MSLFRFSRAYFFLFVLIFLIELAIALWVQDSFFRPYFGDTLVVVLIYCFCQSFFDLPKTKAAVGVLLFAFFVEGLQAVNFISWMGWQDNKLAVTLIGNSFAWLDMLAYCFGFLGIVLFEAWVERRKLRASE